MKVVRIVLYIFAALVLQLVLSAVFPIVTQYPHGLYYWCAVIIAYPFIFYRPESHWFKG